MIISHVKIIAFQSIIIDCLWIFYIATKGYGYFILLYLTREISRSTLEVNLVFPRTHVLFSISTVGIKNWKNKELQKSMILE